MRTKLIALASLPALLLACLPANGVGASVAPSTRQLLIADDFDHDGHTEPTVWNQSTADWNINEPLGQQGPFPFGTAGDIPAVNNDGDGFALRGVFRPSNGTWYFADDFGYLRTPVHYGTRGDIPVQAHYLGYGHSTVLAVFRPSTGVWYVRGDSALHYGDSGDIPVPGHYAGTAANGYADIPAVFRPSTGTWYVHGLASVHYGDSGDIPAPADYNGDGITDIAVYRPSDHTFYIRGQTSTVYGLAGDIPVTGDFNGDGTSDLAVYRPSTHIWYIQGQPSVSFGGPGDVPVDAAPYRD